MSRFSLFRRNKPEAADTDFTPDNTGRKKPGKPSDMDDPILPEKKRARRRLVGAVTITLAAIIVLPMIFDSEPQTVSQDLLIDIPSRDKPSQTVSREPVKKKAEEKPAIVASSDKPASESAAPAASDKKEAAKPDSTKDKPATDTKTDTKVSEKTGAKPEAKPDTKTDTAKKTDDPIGQLIAQQNTNAKDANTKGDEQGKFVIQVAAVSSQEKAKEVQDKLQKAGITSYTQKVALKDGGERIRIRIGPLPSRKEVNSTCAKLSQLKLPCTLVN